MKYNIKNAVVEDDHIGLVSVPVMKFLMQYRDMCSQYLLVNFAEGQKN